MKNRVNLLSNFKKQSILALTLFIGFFLLHNVHIYKALIYVLITISSIFSYFTNLSKDLTFVKCFSPFVLLIYCLLSFYFYAGEVIKKVISFGGLLELKFESLMF